MKYENWRQLAAECQESGISVHAWCKEKKIPGSTCRQWLGRLKKEQQYPKLEKNSIQDSDLCVWGKIELKEMGQQEPQVVTSNSICLKYHDWSIELSSCFNPSLLKQIMKVVESVC